MDCWWFLLTFMLKTWRLLTVEGAGHCLPDRIEVRDRCWGACRRSPDIQLVHLLAISKLEFSVKSEHSSAALLIWFLSWATVWRLFGQVMSSGVRMRVAALEKTVPRYRCLILQHKKSQAVLSIAPPLPHPLLSYLVSPPPHFSLHCFWLCANSFTVKGGGSSARHRFHLVLYSVSPSLPAHRCHSLFRWN